MCVYKIEEIAERVRPVAERYGLGKVYLFGSYARGDASEESDVDLRIDGIPKEHTHWCMGGLYADLEDALQKEIDLVTSEALREHKDDPLTMKFIREISSEERLIYDKTR